MLQKQFWFVRTIHYLVPVYITFIILRADFEDSLSVEKTSVEVQFKYES